MVDVTLSHAVLVGPPADMGKAMSFLENPEHKLTVFTRTPEEDAVMEANQGLWVGKKDQVWWARWRDDGKLRSFLFDHIDRFVGAGFGGDREGVETLARILSDILELCNFDTYSAVALKGGDNHLSFRHALRNMRHFEDGIKLWDTKELHAGKTGIVVAAGPSMTEAIPHLKRLQDKAILYAVGRTLRELHRNDIFPRYTVSCEQYAWDTAIFEGVDTAKSTLCFPDICAPEVVSSWKGPRLGMVNHNLRMVMNWPDSLDGGNSVAHHAMTLAAYQGCNPILLVGVDLGYPKGRDKTHAEGTYHGWPKEIVDNELLPQAQLTVKANDGTDMEGSPAYKNFATLFDILAKRHGKRVFATNPKAQRISGIGCVDLAGWNEAADLITASPPPCAPSSGQAPSLPPHPDVRQEA